MSGKISLFKNVKFIKIQSIIIIHINTYATHMLYDMTQFIHMITNSICIQKQRGINVIVFVQ